MNREEGFIGTSLRKDEYVCDCSDIDDIITFTNEGKMKIVKADTKVFIGKQIIHVAVFKKNDTRTIYNMIYRDGKKGTTFIKRFPVKGVTREKEYNLTQGTPESKVLYFTANPNGEAEIVNIILRNSGNIKKLKWDLDFADLQIKGRNSRGNTVTKYSVLKVELKEKGVSTLDPRKVWFDQNIQRINLEERGELLGEFKGKDKILIIRKNGAARVVDPEPSLHFNDDLIKIEKWIPHKPLTAIYYDPEKNRNFLKRFLIENQNKEDYFIKPDKELIYINTNWRPIVLVNFYKSKNKSIPESLEINVEEFISLKGFKAQGNQLSNKKIKNVELKDFLPYNEKQTDLSEIEVEGEEKIESDDLESNQIEMNF